MAFSYLKMSVTVVRRGEGSGVTSPHLFPVQWAWDGTGGSAESKVQVLHVG